MSWPVALDNVKCFQWPECSHNISSTSKLSNFGPQSHHLSLYKCEEKDIKKSLIICGEKICQPAFKCIFRVDNLFWNETIFFPHKLVYAITTFYLQKTYVELVLHFPLCQVWIFHIILTKVLFSLMSSMLTFEFSFL